jgi:hypothetical protein
MATAAVQVTIGDYAKWRPVFDKYKPLREKAGVKTEHVYRNADNPKEIILWFDAADVAKLREAMGGHDIKAAMQEAGVVGPPRFHPVG